MELLKLVEMYTSRSHVLNCELYKVLVMKIDELRFTVGNMKMLTRCIQKTKTFKSDSPFLKMREHVPYITSPKLRGSRVCSGSEEGRIAAELTVPCLRHNPLNASHQKLIVDAPI
ncbi:hypothetical protein Fot_06784 [Forsythia ovata]|uniref:Uncharacterized protein n=1 Tax=Forsythia ovata TaxID=205694 RepID=A0ABD1WUM0_9LAMI